MNENLKPRTSPDLMRLAAERSSSRPEFLGYLLNMYRQDKSLSSGELASQLVTTEETLNFLYLCRAPASDTEVGSSYKEYIQNISRGLEVDQKKLSGVIRNAMNLQRLKGTQRVGPVARAANLALAARDRLDDAESDSDFEANQTGKTPGQSEDEPE